MLNTAVFSSTLSAPYPQCHSEELCSCQEPPQHPLMKNLCLRTGAPVQQTTGERLASRRRTDTKPTLGRLGSKPEQLCDKQHPRGEKAPSWHVFFLADLQENTVSLDREPGRLGEHSVLTSCLSDWDPGAWGRIRSPVLRKSPLFWLCPSLSDLSGLTHP